MSTTSPTERAQNPSHQSPASPYDPPDHPPPNALPDTRVAELQVMFPTVDVQVIDIILETCGGSQDRAIEQLLSMSDPNFKPDELEHSRQEEASQVDLDAQFARSLQMQDEHEIRQYPRRDQLDDQGQLPYQPRVRRNRTPQEQQTQAPTGQRDLSRYEYQPGQEGPGANPPGMIAVEERLNQYAEVGKQTFNSFLTKAKAKYSEFQATQAAARDAPDRAKESHWGESSGNEPWRRSPAGPGTPTPGGGRGGQQDRTRPLWSDERSMSSRSDSASSESTIDTGPTPLSPHTASNPPTCASPARWHPSDTYDDTTTPARSMSTGSTNRIDVSGRRSPAVGSPDKSMPGSGKIDPAKLGILPKKKVDLLSTSPSSTPPKLNGIQTAQNDDNDNDPNPSLPSAPRSIVSQIPKTPPAGHSPYSLGDSDDDLEYTKNPFDER